MDHKPRPECRGNLLQRGAVGSSAGNGRLVRVAIVLLVASAVILTGASPFPTPTKTIDAKPAIPGKAAAPASGKKALPAPVPPSQPYLAIDKAYLKDGRLHIVIRNTTGRALTPALVREGNVQIRQGGKSVIVPLAKMQPQKGAHNTWRLDTGLALPAGQPVIVSLQNVPGDTRKQLRPSATTVGASMQRPLPQAPPKPVPRRLDRDRTAMVGVRPVESLTAQRVLSFAVASPSTGSVWPRCSIQTIRWKQPEAMGDHPTIKLVQGSYEYPVGYHGAAFDASTEMFSVRLHVPGDIPVGEGARISVTGFSDGPASTAWSAPFTIEANRLDAIRLDSPNGGEAWPLETAHRIAWAVEGPIDNRTLWELDLIKDGRVLVTYPNRSMPGLMVHPESGICSFNWYVNSAFEPGSDYTLRIRPVGTSLSDASDRPFSIVGRRAGVDLRITTSPKNYDEYAATPGWRFNVPYTVYNAGADPTPPFEVAVYLSEDTGLGSDDMRLTTVRHTHNPDSPHRPYIGSTFVTLPETIATGRRYYLICAVDWNDQVTEWDERNNDSSHYGTGFSPPPSIFVHPRSTASRDLAARQIQVVPSGGNRYRLIWNYDRIDFVFPCDSYTYEVRLEVTEPTGAGRVLHAETVTAPGRSGGVNRLGGSGHFVYDCPTAEDGTPLPGRYTFRLTLDSGGRVDELVETNNTLDYVYEVPAE